MKGLFEVCFYIFNMFDAYADPYLIGQYTRGDLFVFGELLVRGRGGMYDKGFGVAYVGEVAGEF